MLLNFLLKSTKRFDIHALGGEVAAGVAKLGQRRWDEVPVLNGSQVQILPSAPPNTSKSKGRVVKVPLRTHVFVYNVQKGVMVKPFNWLLTNSNV